MAGDEAGGPDDFDGDVAGAGADGLLGAEVVSVSVIGLELFQVLTDGFRWFLVGFGQIEQHVDELADAFVLGASGVVLVRIHRLLNMVPVEEGVLETGLEVGVDDQIG